MIFFDFLKLINYIYLNKKFEIIDLEIENRNIFHNYLKLSLQHYWQEIISEKVWRSNEKEIILNSSEKDENISSLRENIKKLALKKCFDYLCKNFSIAENILKEYICYFDCNIISKHQTLSEEFIDEFEHLLRWDYIFLYQPKLSENFLKKHEDKIKINKKEGGGTLLIGDDGVTNINLTGGTTDGAITVNSDDISYWHDNYGIIFHTGSNYRYTTTSRNNIY